MKRLLGTVVLALTSAFVQPAHAQSTAPLLNKGNLIYQGAFRVPQGSSDTTTFNYGGTALTYNPNNNALFVTGHDHHQLTAEISIPAITNSTSIGSLATATLLQAFRNPTEGKLGSINPSDPNSKKIGGHLVFNGKLYVTGYSFYDGNGSQTTSHFERPLSLSTTGQVLGPLRVGSQYPGFVSGYMTPIPAEWQSQFGGPALTGNCCLSITSVHSNGPAASVFNPSQLGQSGTVSATPVVGYPHPNVLGPGEATKNSLFNLATKITGVVFPTGTRSVLFFGRHGSGNYCYGDGSACGDPADSSKGPHAFPYAYYVWAYDANDLLAVKNGSKRQYEIQPYSTWAFNMPFEGSSDAHLLGGAGYDPQTNRIYLAQRCRDGECGPIIHVFKVDGNLAVPRAPTEMRAQ